jgi:DNA (cytosine-5)-methyltransferase 1
MSAYYNEIDPFAAQWLRELIKAGLIADGEVDERSITNVQPEDVRGFTQCHWFAGIGGWSYALRLAGWPDDRPVWTGSCPCQPFSAAGTQGGTDDPRHLWPAWFELIKECRPVIVFGEQVEGAINHGWFDLVSDDLEREGYAIGAAGLPACGVGAFHIRQRLWFVADTDCAGRQSIPDGASSDRAGDRPGWSRSERKFSVSGLRELADSYGRRREQCNSGERIVSESRPDIAVSELVDTIRERGRCWQPGHEDAGDAGKSGQAGFWSGVQWIACSDGKARPVEPSIFPLAYGVSNRVGTLRGAGNAIVPQVAAAFIESYLEASEMIERARATSLPPIPELNPGSCSL